MMKSFILLLVGGVAASSAFAPAPAQDTEDSASARLKAFLAKTSSEPVPRELADAWLREASPLVERAPPPLPFREAARQLAFGSRCECAVCEDCEDCEDCPAPEVDVAAARASNPECFPEFPNLPPTAYVPSTWGKGAGVCPLDPPDGYDITFVPVNGCGPMQELVQFIYDFDKVATTPRIYRGPRDPPQPQDLPANCSFVYARLGVVSLAVVGQYEVYINNNDLLPTCQEAACGEYCKGRNNNNDCELSDALPNSDLYCGQTSMQQVHWANPNNCPEWDVRFDKCGQAGCNQHGGANPKCEHPIFFKNCTGPP